jgi:hypothetical protein
MNWRQVLNIREIVRSEDRVMEGCTGRGGKKAQIDKSIL